MVGEGGGPVDYAPVRCFQQQLVYSRCIRTPLKFNMEPEKGPPEIRRSLLKTIPFRFYVKLWGCTSTLYYIAMACSQHALDVLFVWNAAEICKGRGRTERLAREALKCTYKSPQNVVVGIFKHTKPHMLHVWNIYLHLA